MRIQGHLISVLQLAFWMNANAQNPVYIEGAYHVFRTSETTHILNPSDTILIDRLLTNQDDTTWCFNNLDTISVEQVSVRKDSSFGFVVGENIKVCYDSGRYIDYWHQDDSNTLCRATIYFHSPTASCVWENRYDRIGMMYSNSETYPSTISKVGDFDQFQYTEIAGLAGNPKHSIMAGYNGVKAVTQVKRGILITPFDTINGCTMIKEEGIVSTIDFPKDTFRVVKYYWLKDTVGHPLLTQFYWIDRPDSVAFYRYKHNSMLLKYRLPKTKKTAVKSHSFCRVYPNPIGSCFTHELVPESIEILDILGQRIDFDQSDQTICLREQTGNQLIMIGECNGRIVAKRLIRDHL